MHLPRAPCVPCRNTTDDGAIDVEVVQFVQYT